MKKKRKGKGSKAQGRREGGLLYPCFPPKWVLQPVEILQEEGPTIAGGTHWKRGQMTRGWEIRMTTEGEGLDGGGWLGWAREGRTRTTRGQGCTDVNKGRDGMIGDEGEVRPQ